MTKNKNNLFLWLGLGGLGVLVGSCSLCIVVALLLPTPPASEEPPVAAEPSRAGEGGFRALAATLHFGSEHVEGPASGLLGGEHTESTGDQDMGSSARIFIDATGRTRVAQLYAMDFLGDVDDADRMAMLREHASSMESVYGDVDHLVAFRGRMMFGASAVRVAGGPWEFQTGYAIDEAPLEAFFADEAPPAPPTVIDALPVSLEGELRGSLRLSDVVDLDCLGDSTLEPTHVLRANQPTTQLRIHAESTDGEGLALLLLRPDGVFRCVEGDDEEGSATTEGSFPAGDYEVWVVRKWGEPGGGYRLTIGDGSLARR